MKKKIPNDKQSEIIDAIIDVFTIFRSNVNLHRREVNDKFNVLSAEDWEWSGIEDDILNAIKKISSIS